LARVKQLPELRELHITGTAITDHGLQDVKALRKLTWLVLTNTKATDRGVRSLRNAIPRLEIIY
jgi:hypothetical protein